MGFIILLFDILKLLLSVFFDLIGMLCLLRVYMQLAKVSFINPIGQGILKLTNWLVLPLQRALPNIRRFDFPSLVAAYLSCFVFWLLIWTFAYLLGNRVGVAISSPWVGIFFLFYFAFLSLAQLAIYMLSAIILLNVILSWLQPYSPFWLTQKLCEPVLKPFRKITPQIGGLDFTPFIALLALQVLLIVVRHLY